jgi:hypothetical protein
MYCAINNIQVPERVLTDYTENHRFYHFCENLCNL